MSRRMAKTSQHMKPCVHTLKQKREVNSCLRWGGGGSKRKSQTLMRVSVVLTVVSPLFTFLTAEDVKRSWRTDIKRPTTLLVSKNSACAIG